MNASPNVQPGTPFSLPHGEPEGRSQHQTGDVAWLQEHFETGDADESAHRVAPVEPHAAHGELSDDGWAEAASEPPFRRIVGGFLIFLSIAWMGIVAWAAGQAAGGAASGAPAFVRWAAVASGPLALIGLGWLLFGRSSRMETVRFTRTVQAMRAESEALQAVLAGVEQRIAGNRAALGDETARLMNLGEEAAERLGAVTRDVDAGAQAMARYADVLDRAAGSARTDMGVLLADLPKADAQARAMAEMLRAAGLDAHQQAGVLEAQINAFAAQAREADTIASGAAGRLTAHIAQVESAAQTAAAQMEGASAAMSAGIDATLGKAAMAVDVTREGLEEQGRAMLALVGQSSAAMERAGSEASHALSERVADIGGRIEALAGQIAAQEQASKAIVGCIDRSMGDMETRFAALTADGGERMRVLTATVDGLSGTIDAVLQTTSGGDARVGELTQRTSELRTAIGELGGELETRLPAGFDTVDMRAAQSMQALATLAPHVAELAQAASAAQARLADVETLMARQSGALQALLGTAQRGLEAMQGKVEGFGTAVVDADAHARRLAKDTGPQLIEALVRAREAANQAGERAREAIGAAIPGAAARLGEATGAAMSAALSGHVATQMSEIGALTERAVEAARGASERLTRQMITIGETTAAVEARIAEAQESLRENESEQFSRRVALLIESLNSTAIDVAKILSNDVTDSAWAAYLKGDRGVFTRRAVRLLDTGEAREIVRHYEEEPEFRDQVNRYIHDFEALLRRVLAERDGSPLGVTLLSSDMGKLYVALAQAIERIRG